MELFTLLGTYERERDDFKLPACWRVTNDTCLPHFHNSLEIVYVTKGKLKATLNGVCHDVKEGQLLIVSSYTVHHYETIISSEAVILTVPLDFIPSYDKQFSHNCFAQTIYQDLKMQNSEILHCMSILAKDDLEKKLSINVIKGYIYVIIGMLIERIGLVPTRNDGSQNITKDTLTYLQGNYLSSISLQQLSQNFGYSASRFSHLFNSCFGCTITEYVNTLRCRHASGLLADDSVPIITVAMSSGFSSTRTFYRSFKRCFGVTPSQYRDSCMKKRSKPC